MSLAYTVVVQDREGFESNFYVGTSRRGASKAYKEAIEIREDDIITNEIRYEVWNDGKIVDHLTKICFLIPVDDEHDEDDEDYEDYEDEEDD